MTRTVSECPLIAYNVTFNLSVFSILWVVSSGHKHSLRGVEKQTFTENQQAKRKTREVKPVMRGGHP